MTSGIVIGLLLGGVDSYLLKKRVELDTPVMERMATRLKPEILPPDGALTKTPRLRSSARGVLSPVVISQSPITQNGTNNIAQQGNNNSATINTGLPKRPPINAKKLTDGIAHIGVAVHVSAIANSPEAYEYAFQILRAIQDAKVDTGPDGVRSFMIVGAPWSGVMVSYHGDAATGTQVSVLGDSPVGRLIEAMQNAGVRDISVHPDPAFPVDTLTISVGPNKAD